MRIYDGVVAAPDEPCRAVGPGPGYFDGPSALVPGPNGRLADSLRRTASFPNPVINLTRAALYYLREAGHVTALAPVPTGFAQALADLAVTGRDSYASLMRSVQGGDLPALLLAGLDSEIHARRLVSPSATDRTNCVQRAIDRASNASWALRGPIGRAALRQQLGWIAVSAEDDPPHRPVNVPATQFDQFDILIHPQGFPVWTRYSVASEGVGSLPFPAAFVGLPPEAQPIIPDSHEIILFLHGHSSCLEEGEGLIPHLHSLGAAQGRKLTIVRLDLPCNGYSTMLSHTNVAPSSESKYDPRNPDRCRFPMLEFIEDAVLQFLLRLNDVVVGNGGKTILNRIAAAIGGSLGGNLCLRLARRTEPWPSQIVAWSAASVWESWGRATSSPFDAWPGRGRYVDVGKDIGYNRVRRRMDDVENVNSRAQHFDRVFGRGEPILEGSPFFLGNQSSQWFRSDWGICKDLAVEGGKRFVAEVYNEKFRRWHWRVAFDQLGFSHQDQVSNGGSRSVDLMRKPLLLAAGAEDNHVGTRIYDCSKLLAGWLTTNPGKAIFVQGTGHSIHSERPVWLSNEIVTFLTEKPDPTSWEALRGIIPSPISAVSWGINRFDLFAQSGNSAVWHKCFETGVGWIPGDPGTWESLGGSVIGRVKAVSWGPGRLDLFARGRDGNTYHKFFEGSRGEWGGGDIAAPWEPLGQFILSPPEAVSWGLGRLDLFVLGVDS